MTDDTPFTAADLTPVIEAGGILIKRDDVFEKGGGRGGKVRSCWILAQGAKGLVTAGSRSSPQVNIVAQIGKIMGIPVRCHTPKGELSPEVLMAKEAGAEIIQHKAGYNSVIIKRARDDAAELGYTNIPFGMETELAVQETSKQVDNLPFDRIDKIVMPVGSGMSLAGVLHGLKRNNQNIPVIGVVVGADPVKRLNKYAPEEWHEMVTLHNAGVPYDKHIGGNIEGITLDPIYEAKCLPFLDDKALFKKTLFWIVGRRASI